MEQEKKITNWQQFADFRTWNFDVANLLCFPVWELLCLSSTNRKRCYLL